MELTEAYGEAREGHLIGGHSQDIIIVLEAGHALTCAIYIEHEGTKRAVLVDWEGKELALLHFFLCLLCRIVGSVERGRAPSTANFSS